MRLANGPMSEPLSGLLRRSGRRIAFGAVVGVALLAGLVGTAGPAVASPVAASAHTSIVASVVPEQVTVGVRAATPPPTAPTTVTDINQQQQNADAAQVRRKAVIAVVVVVLLVIVYFGRRTNSRHRRKNRNLQNAKS